MGIDPFVSRRGEGELRCFGWCFEVVCLEFYFFLKCLGLAWVLLGLGTCLQVAWLGCLVAKSCQSELLRLKFGSKHLSVM